MDLAAEPQRASRTQQATPAHAGLVDRSPSGARDRVAQEAPDLLRVWMAWVA